MKYELYHHGILGMKWGIRRYQNEDGSLTPAGRKRYGSFSSDEKRYYGLIKKRPEELSTQELRFINERIQAKNQYENLTQRKSKILSILESSALQTVSTLTSKYMLKGAEKFIDSIANSDLSSLLKTMNTGGSVEAWLFD